MGKTLKDNRYNNIDNDDCNCGKALKITSTKRNTGIKKVVKKKL